MYVIVFLIISRNKKRSNSTLLLKFNSLPIRCRILIEVIKFTVSVFVSNFSRFIKICLLKSNDEVRNMFLKYKVKVKNQLDQKIG